MKKTAFILLLAIFALACAQQGERIVENPNSLMRNSNTLEIAKVIANDTATILHMDAYFRGGWWIKIDPETYIQAGGEKYTLTRADGIEIGAEHYMPESGEDSFILYFPPLPKGVKSFDFIESDCYDCFKIWGVDLTGNMSYKSSMPKELAKFQVPVAGEQLAPARLEVAETRVDVYLHGIPEGYIPSDVLLHVDNFLKGQGEENTPVDKRDGYYSFVFPQYGTARATVTVGEDLFANMILSPGEHAEVHLDIPAYGTTLSRYSTIGDIPYAAFRGLYSKVNTEMNMPGKRFLHDMYQLAFNTSTWQFTDEQYREAILNICDQMERKIENMDISDQLKEVYRQDIKTQAAMAVANKDRFFGYSESMSRPREDVEHHDRPPLFEDFALLERYDLNDPVWMFSGEFADVLRKLINEMMTNEDGLEIMEKLSRGQEGFISDFPKCYNIFNAAEKAEGATLMELAVLNNLSVPFYREAYEMMRGEAMKRRERILSEGGFEIKEAPETDPGNVLESIIAEYRGKPVFVDFWATWCGPCLRGMQILAPFKPEMAEHGVVTLYITNPSSPEIKWLSMLPEIGGIHYYLNREQWSALTSKYNFSGIPQYMVFDRAGNKTFQHTGINEIETKVREELEKVW